MSRFSKLSRDKLVVHCKNYDEARLFVALAHDEGYRWEENPSVVTFWEKHLTESCYRIRTNPKRTPRNIILFNSKAFYNRKGFKVISFQEFLGNEIAASPSRVEAMETPMSYEEPSLSILTGRKPFRL